MKSKGSILNKIVSILTAFMVMFSGLSITTTVQAATGLNMSGTTIRGYAYSNNNFPVYNSTGSGKKQIGTCYGSSDLLTIKGVGRDGWSCITYPAGRTTKTGYCQTVYLFQNPNFSGTTGKVQSNITTYKKSNCRSSYGTTSKGDVVFIVGYNSGNTQILYPCSGYYKTAWVKGNYSISNGWFIKSTGAATNKINNTSGLSSSQIKTMTFHSIYYANRYPDLKAAFGYDEAKLYNHWLTYGIKEGRSASPVLDLYYYLKNNMDLIRAFGAANYSAAYQHFITYGYNEGRNSSEYYHGFYYKNRYSDLRNMSYYNLINHYISYGIKEQRWGNTTGKMPSVSKNIGNSQSASLTSPVPAGCKFSKKTSDNGWYGYHDINQNVSTSTPVYAIADGTVTYKQAYTMISGVKYLTSYGNFIEFTSNDRIYTAKYCHLSRFVGANQKISSSQTKRQSGSTGTEYIVTKNVKKGEVIGYIGKTGNASGVHLHFELRRNGGRIEPTDVINGLQ